MNLEEYYARTFPLDQDKVVKMMQNDSGAIGNVVRGLSRKCFGLAAEIRKHDTMDFFCITSAQPQPGLLLRLKFREPRFYDYLLAFSMDCEKEYPFLQALDVYRALVFYLCQHLESNGYQTVETRELETKGVKPETLLSAFPLEVVQSIDKTAFYRGILGYEKLEFDGLTRYVYLMFDARNDFFKIGESKKPRYRERTLQAKQPEVELLKAWNCDHRIERLLHKKFAAKRVRPQNPRSEWFRLHTGDLVNLNATIEAMKIELALRPPPRPRRLGTALGGAAAAPRRRGLADASDEEASEGSHRSAATAGHDKSGYSGAPDPADSERRLCEAKE